MLILPIVILPVVLGLQSPATPPDAVLVPVQNVPTYDSARNCRAEAVGSLGSKDDISSCMKTEQDKRADLVKSWSGFSASDRSTCLGLSSLGGQATYTELLTCLEIMREARKLPKDTDTVGTGGMGESAPPRRRR